LQRAAAPGDRHLGLAGLSHCACQYGWLYLVRVERDCRRARHAGLCRVACAARGGHRQHADGPARRGYGAPSARGATQADVCPAFAGPGRLHAVEVVHRVFSLIEVRCWGTQAMPFFPNRTALMPKNAFSRFSPLAICLAASLMATPAFSHGPQHDEKEHRAPRLSLQAQASSDVQQDTVTITLASEIEGQ